MAVGALSPVGVGRMSSLLPWLLPTLGPYVIGINMLGTWGISGCILILAVAASEAAKRSANKFGSGKGALEARAGSSVARISTNNCVGVDINMARSSRVGLKRM